MYCKHCGNSIEPDSKFCVVCGRPVSPKTVQSAPAQPQFMNSSASSPDASYAGPASDYYTVTQPTKKKKSKAPIIIIAVILVIIAGIIALTFIIPEADTASVVENTLLNSSEIKHLWNQIICFTV